jgi:hypothetical protein
MAISTDVMVVAAQLKEGGVVVRPYGQLVPDIKAKAGQGTKIAMDLARVNVCVDQGKWVEVCAVGVGEWWCLTYGHLVPDIRAKGGQGAKTPMGAERMGLLSWAKWAHTQTNWAVDLARASVDVSREGADMQARLEGHPRRYWS